MAGTKAGGKKAAETNRLRYGNDFYPTIGAAGGAKSNGGGFAQDRELARRAGRKGGTISAARRWGNDVSETKLNWLQRWFHK